LPAIIAVFEKGQPLRERNGSISAYELIHDLSAKLKALETHMDATLHAMLSSGQTSEEKARVEKLKIEFELELMMIDMNLKHLFQRYQHELADVANDDRQETYLTLDKHEATAIQNAKTLYHRVQALQTRETS
jgi:hypothetical protein